MKLYYTDKDNNVVGPVTREQLQRLVDSDTLPPTTQVCQHGSEEWHPIGKLIHRTQRVATSPQPQNSQQRITQHSTAATPRQTTPTSPAALFFAVLLAIVVGGGLLFFGWKYFVREQSPKPFTLPTTASAPKSSGPIFERKGMLEGEVFIVTKGGQNYKLGLVPVTLYPLETVMPFIEEKTKFAKAELARLSPLIDAAKADMDQKYAKKNAAFDAELRVSYDSPNRKALQAALEQARNTHYEAQNAYYRLLDERSKLMSGGFYFEKLPQPISATQTNSDGKFKLEVPTNGGFVIAANGRRSVGDRTERYYWLIRLSLDGASAKTIMLSNNNLSSEGSPDSLIVTN